RATYGHSVDIELDLPTDDTPDSLYYPTTQEEVALVMETGIRPSDRLMVHLSSTYAKAKIAGLHRVDDPVILVVDAKTSSDDGNIIMRACSSVYLTKEVPPDFVSVAEVEDVPDEEE
ncbi:MAG: RNA 2'-phosphotransferase, partial [Thermoplasmata archaeon]|nr:RNA 2'-phosphotransferase [Thermoplasmata archaeon]